MARPTQTGKKSVNLATGGVRVSRIRRDPPPAMKEKIVDPRERERQDLAIGVLSFALSIFVIILGFGSYSGRTSQQDPVVVRIDE